MSSKPFDDHWLVVGKFIPQDSSESAGDQQTQHYLSYGDKWTIASPSLPINCMLDAICGGKLELNREDSPPYISDLDDWTVILHYFGIGYVMPVEVDGECQGMRYVVEQRDEDSTGEPAARSYVPREDFGPRDTPGFPDSKHRRFLHPDAGPSDCTSNWHIPTAFINLSPRSPISPSFDNLYVGCDDGVIEYSGTGWTRVGSRIGDSKNAWPGMRTGVFGDSVTFSFYGPSARIRDSSSLGSCTFSTSVDGEEGQESTGTLMNEVNNLAPNQTHTITITFFAQVNLGQGVDAPPCELVFEGFTYNPGFATLEEGNDLFEAWNSSRPVPSGGNSGSDLQPSTTKSEPTESAVTDVGSTDPGLPPPRRGTNIGAIIGGVAAAVVVALVVLGFVVCRRRRGARMSGHNDALQSPGTAATPFLKSYQDIDPSADAAALHARNAAAATRSPAGTSDLQLAVPFVKFYEEHTSRSRDGDSGVTGLLEDSNTSSQTSAPESDLTASEVAGSTVPLGSTRNQTRDDEPGGDQRIHEVLRAIVERMDAMDRPPAYAAET